MPSLAPDSSSPSEHLAEYRQIVESVRAIVWRADATTFRFTFVSPEAEAILGYPVTRWVAEKSFWVEHIHPDDRAWAVELCTSATRDGRPHEFEYRMIAADGRTVWLHDKVRVLTETGGPRELIGIMVDVTERKQAQVEAGRANERFRLAAEAVGSAIYDWDLASDRIERTSGLFHLLGFLPDDVPPAPEWWRDRIHPDDRERVIGELRRALHDAPRFMLEYRARDKNGEYVHVWDRGIVVRGKDGRATRVVGCMFDITSRREAEEALRASEANYRALIQNANYGILQATPDGRLRSANPALVQMLGYDSDQELLRLNLAHDVFVDPFEPDRFGADKAPGAPEPPFDTRWKRKDGSVIVVRLAGRSVLGETGAIDRIEIIADDITEHRGLEEQLRQAQKMEAVGQLTGGIAHDFNNLLTVILANADLVASALPEGLREARADLEGIQGAARRGAAMIRKLLAFSRREKLEMRPLDLGRLVQEMSSMLRRVLPEHIQVEIRTAGEGRDMPPVAADSGAVEQILLNLATNARDAMPAGGALRIETRPIRFDEEHRAVFGWGTPGAYVCITVSDTGTGMSPATQARIFEPFFTTKPPGAGSGLGMAMIYGLVKQHGGFVGVYSEMGMGTTVKVFFPVVEGAAQEAAVRHEERLVTGGTETILLVEDEEPIRRSATRVLERFGYTVFTAEDGSTALDTFRAHATVIDLVISDVVMPRMGGRALHDALRAEGHGVPFLFTSGYTARDVRETATLDPGAPFLHKPWNLSDLLIKTREVLDQHPHLPDS